MNHHTASSGHDALGTPDEPAFAEREVCVGAPGSSEAASFVDGKEDITVNMVLGSATLADVQVSLTGVAR